MAQYTAGELKNFYYIPEVTYGTTPTDALTYGGSTIDVKPRFSPEQTWIVQPGSRGFGAVARGVIKTGFSLQYHARVASGAYDWTDLAAVYAFGAAGGLADHLGSFTAQTGVTQAGTTHYHFWNGCKINALTISAEGSGMPLVFDADIWARYPKYSTSKTITGLQGVTVGADPTDITTAVCSWNQTSQINLGGGGLVDWHPQRWSLAVDNHLDLVEGNITGADTLNYAIPYAMSEGERDIIFEATLASENETYSNAKIAGTAVTSLTVDIDDETITLANGEFEVGELGPRKQGLMEETVKIRFKSLTIA